MEERIYYFDGEISYFNVFIEILVIFKVLMGTLKFVYASKIATDHYKL